MIDILNDKEALGRIIRFGDEYSEIFRRSKKFNKIYLRPSTKEKFDSQRKLYE